MMVMTSAERNAQRRANAPDRDTFLAQFTDDGHTARIVIQDSAEPLLLIACPYADNVDHPETGPGCNQRMCLIKEWYSDLGWEAMEVQTFPEDSEAAWPQWHPGTIVQRLLWRWHNGDEFYMTFDDVPS